MRRRRRCVTNSKNMANVREPNERFVAMMCGIYLQRLLERYPDIFFTCEAIQELYHWVLGREARDMVSICTQMVVTDDTDDDGSSLSAGKDLPIILQGISPQDWSYVVEHALAYLEKRVLSLRQKAQCEIERNMAALAKMFDLNDNERELCLFLFIATNWRAAENVFNQELNCLEICGQHYIRTILRNTQRELREILQGNLSRIGLVQRSLSGELTIDLELQDLFVNPSSRVISEKFFTRTHQDRVPLENHLIDKDKTDHILSLLRKKPKGSTHILLYGAPGTGKTRYACGLIHESGLPGYEIIRNDPKDNSTSVRRAAIVACLNMTSRKEGSVILVDEADNVLNTQFSWFRHGETQDKAWLNQILEEPGTRMIWITNRIEDIEESVLRRFAFSLPFRPFSRRQRELVWESILRKHKVKRLFTLNEMTDLSARFPLSAGAIDIAVRKAVEAGIPDREGFHKAVVLSLDAHQTLVEGGMKVRNREKIENRYSLEGLNVQGDVDAMMNQLDAFDRYLRSSKDDEPRNMNLLFYGPPGTGKSELARYIGERLKREVLVKRASDLLSMWVGETEKGIRHAFIEAEHKESVLVIDEADSLIFGREKAEHSWEISFTNEFLAQMERFRGIMICTTNLFSNVDSASIRRFNHKVGFHYLKPEGVLLFYDRFLAPFIGSPLSPLLRDRLRAFNNLSPGDFKVVRERFAYIDSGTATHEGLIQALGEEVRAKEVHLGKKQVGF